MGKCQFNAEILSSCLCPRPYGSQILVKCAGAIAQSLLEFPIGSEQTMSDFNRQPATGNSSGTVTLGPH